MDRQAGWDREAGGLVVEAEWAGWDMQGGKVREAGLDRQAGWDKEVGGLVVEAEWDMQGGKIYTYMGFCWFFESKNI